MCATRGGPLWISRSPSVPAWQAMSSLTQGSPETLDSTRARRTPFEALGPIGEVRAKHLPQTTDQARPRRRLRSRRAAERLAHGDRHVHEQPAEGHAGG